MPSRRWDADAPRAPAGLESSLRRPPRPALPPACGVLGSLRGRSPAKPPGSGLRVTRLMGPRNRLVPSPPDSASSCLLPAGPGVWRPSALGRAEAPQDVTFPPFPSRFHVLLHVAVVRRPWVNCCVSTPKEGANAIYFLVR